MTEWLTVTVRRPSASRSSKAYTETVNSGPTSLALAQALGSNTRTMARSRMSYSIPWIEIVCVKLSMSALWTPALTRIVSPHSATPWRKPSSSTHSSSASASSWFERAADTVT